MTPDFGPLWILVVVGLITAVALVAFGPLAAMAGLEYLLSPRTGPWGPLPYLIGGGWAFIVVFGTVWTIWGPRS